MHLISAFRGQYFCLNTVYRFVILVSVVFVVYSRYMNSLFHKLSVISSFLIQGVVFSEKGGFNPGFFNLRLMKRPLRYISDTSFC